MFSFGRTSRSDSRASDRPQQAQQASGRSSIFSLSRKSSIASIKEAVSGQSSVQSSAYSSAHTSAFTSAYNSRPPSVLLPLRHVDSIGDIPDSPISPVSPKAATLLGIANRSAGTQSPGPNVKPWYSRGRKLRRRNSQASMASVSTADVDDSHSRRGSDSAPTTPHSTIHISGPMGFQHITHTSPQHFHKMKSTHSQNDLLAEFSAIRASQVPQRALRGIKAGAIHSRSPSLDNNDHSITPSLEAKGSRESMNGTAMPSSTGMHSPQFGQPAAHAPSPTFHLHRLRQPPGSLPSWTATRLALHGYASPPPVSSPASPQHVRPEDVGVAVPLDERTGWRSPNHISDSFTADADNQHGFHAVSTPGEVAWELAPSSTLPFDLLPSLCEEDESSSRPVSSVTTINRGSVIHRGCGNGGARSATATAAANSRQSNTDANLLSLPIMEDAEGDRVVSVIHHPPQRASVIAAPAADEGLFSSWNAESDTESVADGEALLESAAPSYRWSKASDPAPSSSPRVKSWRDSQASTIPNSGTDDYNKLLDDIIEPHGDLSTWTVDIPALPKSNRWTRDQARKSQVSAYPMSPEDGDESPDFDPYTAPLPPKPDSLPSPGATIEAVTKAPSIRSDRTSASIISDMARPKRNPSMSKKVAFAEHDVPPNKLQKSPASRIPRPVHRRGSSASSAATVPAWPEEEVLDKPHQRHSTGQVQRSKSSVHRRKLSSPDGAMTGPHRRSSSTRSDYGATTTATNAGYSFVRLSASSATRVAS